MDEAVNHYKLVKSINQLILVEFSGVHNKEKNDRPIHLIKLNGQPVHTEF
jgi:hypothetical protein